MYYLKNIFLYKIEMLYYNRIDVSEGIDVNKTRESKECNSCHYWYFLNKGFKFQADVSMDVSMSQFINDVYES